MRYRGQGYELNVPYTRGMIEAFRREHERRYGYSYPGREVELVTLRLRARIKSRKFGDGGNWCGEVKPGGGAARRR